jgi:integrase
LLGAVTGLRACDIVKLRLADIHWEKGEIKIAQAKTGVSLALPLTKDIGEAIKDYILNGRQDCESEAVFLTIRRDRGFINSEGLRYLYNKYRRQANLPRDAFDGKGFHSLRRAIGKRLVTAGIPVETVAQVIGDRNVDSVKKYIALDSRHLKECALDFSGLPRLVAYSADGGRAGKEAQSQ